MSEVWQKLFCLKPWTISLSQTDFSRRLMLKWFSHYYECERKVGMFCSSVTKTPSLRLPHTGARTTRAKPEICPLSAQQKQIRALRLTNSKSCPVAKPLVPSKTWIYLIRAPPRLHELAQKWHVLHVDTPLTDLTPAGLLVHGETESSLQVS